MPKPAVCTVAALIIAGPETTGVPLYASQNKDAGANRLMTA